jgi:hypothetical protein
MTKKWSNFHNGAIKLKNIIKSLWILNKKGVNNQLYIVQARPEFMGKIKYKSARFIN